MSEAGERRGSIGAKVIGLVLFTLVFVLVCRPIHFSGPFSGAVVDSRTGEPVAGAIVVASWEMRGLENAYVSTLAVGEAVSDAGGDFEVAGWGPKFVGPKMLSGRDREAPRLLIFKPGYRPTAVRNGGTGPPFRISGPVELSERFVQVPEFPLERFEGTLEAYVDLLKRRARSIGPQAFRDARDCVWQRLPKYVVALDTVGTSATHRGIYAGASLSMYNRPPGSCGGIAEFFAVPDDGLEPCETAAECVAAVVGYEGPPEAFWLAVTSRRLMDTGDPRDPVVQALADRGWRPDGFEMREGYVVHRAAEVSVE